ncbi:hypothetical protein GCM10009843_29530 [Nocardioides bigeumensis]|uniref:GGDEF domain-containing protein n=2 Tax=Nocardioides bigeumensis TaxID=433657 RepID=A0ABP5K8F1_9ACTN
MARSGHQPVGPVDSHLLSDPDAVLAVLNATRAFLRVTSREETVEILHAVIAELDGEVVPAAPDGASETSDQPTDDVSLGVGEPMHVVTLTPSRAPIVEHLPALLRDAALASDRADEMAAGRAKDALTGVVSQGRIAARLGAAKSGAVVCILDLDGFKRINERYGHLAGDATLRRFGKHLRDGTRPGDFVARAGGDEFLVIIEGDVEISAAYRRMSGLAAAWAQAEQHISSVSIGVAAVGEAGPTQAAAAADRAMYRAKRSGLGVEIARDSDESQVSGSLVNETFEAYFKGLVNADTLQSSRALSRGAEQGMSQQALVQGVIGRAQSAVGAGWATGDWGIAEEHAATLVAEQALTLLSPPPPRSPTAVRVVMACAEGEMHSMPVRMAAQLARSADLDIVVLGGSMPAADLGASLRILTPAVLGLSVTVATNLIGAHRCILQARAVGIRVIVGGAAWGTSQHRAQRLGASLMLREVSELARYVHEGGVPDLGADPAPLDDEAILLERPPPELMQDAVELWCSRQQTAPSSSQRHDALEALDWVARHAAAAVACDDASVLGDLVESQVRAAGKQGEDLRAIRDVYDALADALTAAAPCAADMLRSIGARLARAQAGQGPGDQLRSE